MKIVRRVWDALWENPSVRPGNVQNVVLVSASGSCPRCGTTCRISFICTDWRIVPLQYAVCCEDPFILCRKLVRSSPWIEWTPVWGTPKQTPGC